MYNKEDMSEGHEGQLQINCRRSLPERAEAD